MDEIKKKVKGMEKRVYKAMISARQSWFLIIKWRSEEEIDVGGKIFRPTQVII
jgi:hypothetical protein